MKDGKLVEEVIKKFAMIPCEEGESPLLHLQELAQLGIEAGRREGFQRGFQKGQIAGKREAFRVVEQHFETHCELIDEELDALKKETEK